MNARQHLLSIAFVVACLLLVGLLAKIASDEAGSDLPQEPPRQTPPDDRLVYPTRLITLHDDQRQKDIPIRATWPGDGGPYPIIVFSHGAFANQNSYTDIIQYWVAHGYVCLQPGHNAWTPPQPRDDTPESPDRTAERQAIEGQLLLDRAGDIRFAIDAMDELQHRIPALQDKINPQRIGVGGHSQGAFAAALIGGAKVKASETDEMTDATDSRVTAILLLSPSSRRRMGMNPPSMTTVSGPMLVLTSPRGWGSGGDFRGSFRGRGWGDGDREPSAATQPLAFEHDPQRDKFTFRLPALSSNMLTQGAGQNTGQFDGRYRWAYAYVQSFTLDFWEAYLKNDAAAKARLSALRQTTEQEPQTQPANR